MFRMFRGLLESCLIFSWTAGVWSMAGAQEKDKPAAPSKEAVAALVKEYAQAGSALERGRLERRLVAFGPAALEAVREAGEQAAAEPSRQGFKRLRLLLLAQKLTPFLKELMDTNLVYDGQYAGLKAAGPETVEALLFLFNDEGTTAAIRLGAARALADLGDASLVPELRRLESDPLLFPALREEAGTLMAIHGDSRRADQKIRELAKELESKDPRVFIGANLELANIYYKIRKYSKATDCYERVITVFEAARKNAGGEGRAGLDRQLALHYYNAACSYTLQEKFDKAKSYIRKAIELDSSHFNNLERDGDFKKLRDSPGYPELRQELAKLLEKDSI
ncbi:MAG: hypothetical protein HY717_02120 [Planctomycetes bacterium]|nr:hypothetical protein [Planctomycetota bacterium]